MYALLTALEEKKLNNKTNCALQIQPAPSPAVNLREIHLDRIRRPFRLGASMPTQKRVLSNGLFNTSDWTSKSCS